MNMKRLAAIILGGTILPFLTMSMSWCADKPLIVAHYMGWFGLPELSGQWYQWKFALDGVDMDKHHYPEFMKLSGKRDIASNHYPLIGPYDSADPAVLEYHILLAKEAGIDAFMINWYGFKNDKGEPRQEDRCFAALLSVAEQLDFKVCINFDDKCSFPPFQNTTNRRDAVLSSKKTIEEVYRKYMHRPSYLKINGKAVLSNFGWAYATSDSIAQTSFKAQEWRDIFGELRDRIFFMHDHQWGWKRSIAEAGFTDVSDAIFPWVGSASDRESFLTESEQLRKQGKVKMVVGVANPGFDNSPCWGWGGGIINIPRRDGQEYRDQMEDSVRHHSDFIQLVTWNDFTEGSNIEPTEEYGDLYLNITAEYARKWQPDISFGSALDLPGKIYALRVIEARLKKSGLVSAESVSEISADIERAILSFLKRDRAASEQYLSGIQSRLEHEEKELPKPKQLIAELRPSAHDIFAGENADLSLYVKNPHTETLPVYIDINRYNIPRSWMGDLEKVLYLKPGEDILIPFTIKVPKEAGGRVGWFTATVDCPYSPVVTNASYVKVYRPYIRAEIGPVNLLRRGQEENLTLTFETRQKEPIKAEINFQTPPGWKTKIKKSSVELPKEGSVSLPFTLTISEGAPANGTLAVQIKWNNGEITVHEPYAVLTAGLASLMTGDINQDGTSDFAIGNEKVEFHATPAIGGRLLSAVDRASGRNQLFLDYPGVERTRGDAWNAWAEYGGVNDWFPADWPGEVWNVDWDARVKETAGDRVSVVLSTVTRDNLFIQKEFSLTPQSSGLKMEYEIRNLGNTTKPMFWTNHPDLAPGGSADGQDQYIVPALDEKGRLYLARGNFEPRLQKSHLVPGADWILAYDSADKGYLLQTFSRGLVDKIGVWEGKSFFTMELNFKKENLKPGAATRFGVDYIVGQDDLDTLLKKHELKLPEPEKTNHGQGG